MSPGNKKLVQIIMFAAVVIVIFKVDWWLHGERPTQQQESIKKELREIPRYPDSKQVSLNSTYKTTSGVLDEENVSNRDSVVIEQWYSSEVGRLGWVSIGTDMRGKEKVLKFCRNNETANLIIRQNESRVGARDTSYKVQIGWGGPWACSVK